MGWPALNLFAEWNGVQFLGFYAIVIFFVLVITRRGVVRSDPTRDVTVMKIPLKPDPYAIAYLRGGVNAVTRLALFDLMQQGHLQEIPDENLLSKTPVKIGREQNSQTLKPLSGLQREVLEFFEVPQTIQAIFLGGRLTSRVKVYCEDLDAVFREEAILSTREQSRKSRELALAGCLLLLILGGYRLSIALAQGRHNVGFLIILILVGMIATLFAARVSRLTKRGRAYLSQLEIAFAGLRTQVNESSPDVSGNSLLLVPAIFGLGALSATPYAKWASLFRASPSSGCSAGCGASGCGGAGGGGGGCGGGGGGGGGCGGGCGGCGG